MIYLTKHANQAAYDAVKNNLATPQVAFIVENNGVVYQPYVDPSGGHPFVEIGGVKWATMNVGATSVTDYGNYYQYGKGSEQYAATSGDSAYSGEENPLAATADTATQEWGGSWRMPTKAEFDSLTANTTHQWVTNYQGSGKNGATFTANGQTLFIPAAGCYYNGSQNSVGTFGYVRSSTPDGSGRSYNLSVNRGANGVDSGNRNGGYSVRPVLDA